MSQCCGITQNGNQCTRKTNNKFCHQHDEKDVQTCAVITNATADKLKSLNLNLTDLEINSITNCNCNLISKISEFWDLEFLTLTLQNFCDKPNYSI